MSSRNKGSMEYVTVSREPDRSGNFICDGTGDEQQIQDAIDSLPTTNRRTGVVYVKRGTYDILNDITIGKNTYLIGETCEGTIFQAGANMASAMIIIDPADIGESDVKIANLYLDLNDGTQRTGDGIKCTHLDHETSLRCRAQFENLRIWDIGTNQQCMDIADMRAWYMNMLYLNMNGSGATGIKLTTTTNIHRGEGVADYILIGGFGGNANTTGIDIDGSGGASWSAGNVSRWYNCHLGGVTSGYGAGSIGLRIYKDYDIEFHGHFEGQETNVHLEGASGGDYVENITFIHPSCNNSGTDANQRCFHFGDYVFDVKIFGGSLTHATNGNAWNEARADGQWYKPIQFHGTKMQATGGTAPSWAGGGTPYIHMYDCSSPDVNGIAHLESETIAGAAWVDPTGPAWRGRVCVQRNTGAGQTRWWAYDDTSTWRAMATV